MRGEEGEDRDGNLYFYDYLFMLMHVHVYIAGQRSVLGVGTAAAEVIRNYT